MASSSTAVAAVNYSRDMAGGREVFIREALVAARWETRLPFPAANQSWCARWKELEHKRRRQDVLVDDELIYAFYDQQLPADVCSGYSQPGALVPRRAAKTAQPAQAHARRTDAPRGRGHHHRAFPKTIAWAAWTARPPTCTSPATRATA